MALFEALFISGSALTAERLRMDLIASNLANVDVRGAQPYQERVPLFATLPDGGVAVTAIVTNPTPGPLVYDPGNPAAVNGYVRASNVNPTLEVVDLISAERAYEANASAIATEKQSWQAAFGVLV